MVINIIYRHVGVINVLKTECKTMNATLYDDNFLSEKIYVFLKNIFILLHNITVTIFVIMVIILNIIKTIFFCMMLLVSTCTWDAVNSLVLFPLVFSWIYLPML